MGLEVAAARAAPQVFEIPIDLGQPADVLRAITQWAAAGSNGGPAKRGMYANAHVLNQSVEGPQLRDILGGADPVYCDGYRVRAGPRAPRGAEAPPATRARRG